MGNKKTIYIIGFTFSVLQEIFKKIKRESGHTVMNEFLGSLLIPNQIKSIYYLKPSTYNNVLVKYL